jgi:hypothetical protein
MEEYRFFKRRNDMNVDACDEAGYATSIVVFAAVTDKRYKERTTVLRGMRA